MAYLKPQTPLKDLNSGDYFYPLTTIDQVQRSDGSRVQDYDLGNVALEDSETAPGPGTPQMTTLMNMVYPIGSIYMSVNATSPASLFGGTWEQIQDRFLLAAGSTYSAGSTGGSATHTHTIAHTHTMAHTHTLSHTHTTPATTTGGTAISVAQMPSHMHEIKGVSWAGNLGIAITRPGATDSDGSWFAIQDYAHDTNYHYSTPAGSNSSLYAVANGSGSAHTHSQVATTTNSQNTATTSAASNATTSASSAANSGSASTLPPYLTVYMWKRTA